MPVELEIDASTVTCYDIIEVKKLLLAGRNKTMPGTSPLVLYKSVKGVVLCQTMRYFLWCV